MFMGDKLIRWDKRADESEIPDLSAAIRAYQAPEKQALMKQASVLEPIPWMAVKASVIYSKKGYFENSLDFLVNVPGLQEKIASPEVTGEWYWEPMKAEAISARFNDSPELLDLLLKECNIEDQLLAGWVLRKEYGRVDEDTTYSNFSYLFETGQYFVHLDYYRETLH